MTKPSKRWYGFIWFNGKPDNPVHYIGHGTFVSFKLKADRDKWLSRGPICPSQPFFREILHNETPDLRRILRLNPAAIRRYDVLW